MQASPIKVKRNVLRTVELSVTIPLRFRMKPAFALELDHLIVAARTLEDGARHVAEMLGVEPVAGGAHPRMGTHNRLLGLFGTAYLEIIAIDPDAEHDREAAGARAPRWFALDDEAMNERLAAGPFLAHWAVRVERPKDLGRWQAQYPSRIAPVIPMSRGDLRWRLTVPVDGAFPSWQEAGDGVLPTLIQWDTAAHPATRLPATGLALNALKARHPRPEPIREQLAWLGASQLIELDDAPADAPSLTATIETPAGMRVLR